jgi:hypothetical protein
MKKRLSITGLLFNTIVAMFVSAFISIPLHGDPSLSFVQPLVFVTLLALQFVPTNTMAGVFMSDIRKEVWVSDIAENIFPDNSAIGQSIDDSQYLDGHTVHLPQAGSVPSVTKNRTSLPATAVPRIDTIQDYDVDEYTTDPSLVTITEEIEASYDKRQSILRDHQDILMTKIFNNILYGWMPTASAQQVATTGSSRSAYLSGQTGNRKQVALNDIIDVQAKFNNADIPQEGRNVLIDALMYKDFQKLSEFQSWDKMGTTPLVKGSLGQILGFNVWLRSTANRYDNAGAPKAVDAAVAATDDLFTLFWHRSFVRKAVGTTANGGIQVFYNENDPSYYGSVFSALVRGGAKKRYTDGRGIVALIETNV